MKIENTVQILKILRPFLLVFSVWIVVTLLIVVTNDLGLNMIWYFINLPASYIIQNINWMNVFSHSAYMIFTGAANGLIYGGIVAALAMGVRRLSDRKAEPGAVGNEGHRGAD
jgi:cell division protein FtsW (lipid II flippase)